VNTFLPTVQQRERSSGNGRTLAKQENGMQNELMGDFLPQT
jgi:hypothetical protein